LKNTLPSGWQVTTISEVAEIVTGSTPSPKKSEYYGGIIPFVTPGDLDQDLPITKTAKMVTEQGAAKGRLLPIGTVLVSCIGNLGKVGILDTAGISNQQINSIVPNKNIESKFIKFWVPTIRTWMEENSSATTVTIINKGRFSLAPVLLPPLLEQKRIATKIDALQAKSKKAREALNAARPLLDKLRQSILAAAFRGDLTADWRKQNPDVEPASKLLERIRIERRQKWEEAELAKMRAKGKEPKNDKWKARYKEPAPVDTAGLPELPDGWCWARLEAIALIKGGLTKGKKRKKTDCLNDIPYLRVANVQRGFLNLTEVNIIQATDVEILELALCRGDILFNEGGDRDKLGRGWVWNEEIKQCIHQNHVFRARLVSDALVPELISHFGNSFGQQWFMDEGKQSTNLASLNLTKLSKFPIPVMPEAEGQELLKLIRKNLKKTSHILEVVNKTAEQIQALDQSILSKAFRGELVPQDPNDEPAAILLQRIKAEQEATKTNKKRQQKRT
jgi:type I restriction enzyme S subunit